MGRWIRLSAILLAFPTLLLAGLGVYSLAMPTSPRDGAPFSIIALVRPAFAQTNSSFPEFEAGMAAYADLGEPIDLNAVSGRFYSVELETEEWVIRVVPMTFFAQAEWPRVFVHQQGWIVAYYEPDSPVARAAVWDNGSLNLSITKLQRGIYIVSNALGIIPPVRYYNFEFPNATDWVLAVGSDGFNLNIPSQIQVFDRSFAHHQCCSASIPGLPTDNSAGIAIDPA